MTTVVIRSGGENLCQKDTTVPPGQVAAVAATQGLTSVQSGSAVTIQVADGLPCDTAAGLLAQILSSVG